MKITVNHILKTTISKQTKLQKGINKISNCYQLPVPLMGLKSQRGSHFQHMEKDIKLFVYRIRANKGRS